VRSFRLRPPPPSCDSVLASRNIPVQNIQFRRNIPVQNTKEYSGTKHSVSRIIPVQNIQFGGNIPVQNTQPEGIFQYKILSQKEYSGSKHSVSRNIPVQNIRSVGIFRYNTFNSEGIFRFKTPSQKENSRTKHSVGRNPRKDEDKAVRLSKKYSVSRNISMPNIQPRGILPVQSISAVSKHIICQCSKNDFSKKYQYSNNDFGKKCQCQHSNYVVFGIIKASHFLI
jgi:hypothetical protein